MTTSNPITCRLGAILLGVAGACGGQSPTPAVETGAPARATRAVRAERELRPSTELRVQTLDGVVLVGSRWPGPQRVSNTDEPNGIIVLAHQLGSTRSEWEPFVRELAPSYTVVAFDMRGHGESTRRIDDSIVGWQDFGPADWALLPTDIGNIVKHVVLLEPEHTAVSLAGSSIGGSAVLLYAADDPSIHSVAAISPGLAYHGLYIESAVEQLADRNVLLLAAEADRDSAAATRRLAQHLREGSAKVYPGAGHGVSMDGPVVRDAVEFLRKTPPRIAGSER